MKIVFAVIFLIHGLLHLLGVIQALKPESLPQFSGKISSTEGILWLLTSLIFLAAFIFYLTKKEWWPIAAIIGVVLSQTLIFFNWQDAKYGTLLNLLILAIALPTLGRERFDKMTLQEIISLLSTSESAFPLNNVHTLPPVVQKWLKVSGALAYPVPTAVRLEQKGKMRTSKKGKWMPFRAVQYFNTAAPAFVWKANVKPLPFIHLSGRDKLKSGKGEMLIQLCSLITVAHAAGDRKVDSGTLQRFMGEICWFPAAALRPYFVWEEISDTSAKAIMVQQGLEVEGIFNFSGEGKLLSFETLRYFGTNKNAKKEKWSIKILENAVFEGISVPSRCEVSWQLPEGDFHWLSLEITSLQSNPETVNI